MFCACDIACCRPGCFRSAVTRLHTCTHYSMPAFRHSCWCAQFTYCSFHHLSPSAMREHLPLQRCHADTQSTHFTHLVSTTSAPPYLLRLLHTCRCFKILFPATDPYASSLVVLQSLMKYCPQAQIISMPDFVEQCSEASCRYELLYSISPYSFRLPHIDARTISSQLLCGKW